MSERKAMISGIDEVKASIRGGQETTASSISTIAKARISKTDKLATA